MLEENIDYFDEYSHLSIIKVLDYKGRKYLIIKLYSWDYIIVDIDDKHSIDESEFKSIFNEQFFIDNFSEKKVERGFELCDVSEYEGDIQELLDFYIENKDILSLPSGIHYRHEINDALTYLNIDFVNESAQMGFQTPDQFLYEQLFLNYDITPLGLQDAHSRIGKDRMREMFERIRQIKIPKEVIPEKLYELYLNQNSNNELKKKLEDSNN